MPKKSKLERKLDGDEERPKRQRKKSRLEDKIGSRQAFSETSSMTERIPSAVIDADGVVLEETDPLYQKEMARQYQDQLFEGRRRKLRLLVRIGLIAACFYLVFLVYGAFNTQYIYDDAGNVVPNIVTIDEIRAKENFLKLLIQYRKAREVYQDVLLLDYRMGAGQEETLLIAPEYEKVLDKVEDLTIQLGAVELPSEYNQVLKMLEAWVKNDVAIYCQNMSGAIAQNNTEYAQRALQYKSVVYNDFALLTNNVLTLSQPIRGLDISDVADWSPESFIQKTTAEGGQTDA